MAVKLSQGFHITSTDAIDDRLVLTKEQMAAMNENLMPDKYIAICRDDGQLYTFNKNVIAVPSIGKFRPYNAPTYFTVNKMRDYLYALNYTVYDYELGYKYLEQFKLDGACSQIRKGNFVGRNFDWNYSTVPEFVITTPAVAGKYATTGVAYGLSGMTDIMADSGEYISEYALLPFMCVDVINEKGVYCGLNVVPAGDKGRNTNTTNGDQEICQLMLPRYLCDYAATAAEAVELISHLSVYAPLNEHNEELHLMVCDNENSYIVEFINNTMVVFQNDQIPNQRAIMTNFYIDGWNGSIKAVFLGNSEDQTRSTGLTDHAMGIERYNILNAGYAAVNDAESMKNLMKSVKYTQMYDETMNPYWYSELTGVTETFGDLTIYNNQADFAGIKQYVIDQWQEHERDSGLWQTVHTSIYDIQSKRLIVYAQEDYENEYVFDFNLPGKPVGLKIDEEESQRKASDIVLQNQIDTEIEEREDADDALNALINTEIGDRQAADIVLDQKIDEIIDTTVWEHGTGTNSAQTKNTGCAANGQNSVAEGLNTVANSNYSHAEGYASKTVIDLDDTDSQGSASHAEGTGTTAKGASSHAEGGGTLAIGRDSHAEGNSTTTGGGASHAEGNWTITNNFAEHAEGTFNKSNMASSSFGDAGNTLHSIGFGSSTGDLEDDRKNAFEIMQNGDVYMFDVGDYDGTNIDVSDTLQDIVNGKENTSNKVTSISSSSTDTQYPSAKAVNTAIADLNITQYALITETGNKITLEMDSSTFQLKAKLFDKNNNLLSTSSVIDLPLEEIIVSIAYDSSTKELVITLKSGTVTRVPVGDIVSGLASQNWVTEGFAPKSDFTSHVNNSTIHITASERTDWNEKYAKPETGIPKTDLATGVQTSLGLADTALQEHQDISGKEDKSNKVTSWAISTSDTKYPSEKLVKTSLNEKASVTDLTTHTNNENIHVTSLEKAAWNAKYDKDDNGIPMVDLSATVQGYLTNSVQKVSPATAGNLVALNADGSIRDSGLEIDGTQEVTEFDIVTSIDSDSSNYEIPTARAVYNSLSDPGKVKIVEGYSAQGGDYLGIDEDFDTITEWVNDGYFVVLHQTDFGGNPYLFISNINNNKISFSNIIYYYDRTPSKIYYGEWRLTSGSHYLDWISKELAALPYWDTYQHVGKVLTVTSNGLAWQ